MARGRTRSAPQGQRPGGTAPPSSGSTSSLTTKLTASAEGARGLALVDALLAPDEAARLAVLRDLISSDAAVAAAIARWRIAAVHGESHLDSPFVDKSVGERIRLPQVAGNFLAGRLVDFVRFVASEPDSAERLLCPEWKTRILAICALVESNAAGERAFQQRLWHEKVESLKEFAYGAGHEINNPLANISARAQTLLRDETHPERRRLLATINRQAFRAHEMIADLMLFARPPELVVEEFDVADVVKQLAGEFDAVARDQATAIDLRELQSLGIVADRAQFVAAVKAVVANALEALAAGGVVSVEVRAESAIAGGIAQDMVDGQSFDLELGSANTNRSTAADRPGVAVIVTDDGPGLSQREREHLFDPFFSGREAGRGLGFGLCKAWRIVTEHRGTIRVMSPLGDGSRGTRVVLWFPRGAAE